MPKLIGTDFLNSPEEYAIAESVWRDRWMALLGDLDQLPLWETPWLNTTFANGVPFRDGNPIFSAICPSRRLGIRVIQVEAGTDTELQTWTDDFGQRPVKELVVSCTLTEKNLDRAFKLIRSWITEKR